MNKQEMLTLIQKADKAYYEKSTPIMSDTEYDVLRRQFIDTYGSDALNYVPTDTANADFVHPYEVISLGKVKAGDDASLRNWLNKKADDGTPFIPVRLQKKEDGCTVVTYVVNGKLTVVSRGDGTKGKILTNIPAKYDVPMDIDYPIRSEAIFTKTDFDAIQQERTAQGLEPFKNIRNAVSGVLQSKEKSPYLDRVTFVAYDVMGSPMNVDEQLAYIREHTPYEVIESVPCNTTNEAVKLIPELFTKWNKENDPIDGVVVKSNVRDGLKLFGTTGHHPLHSFAYKAEQTGAVTILRSVEWQVGREKLTAVANFDPVEIDGTIVTKASVANMGIIREKGLSIGAKILVIKSNQIIPFVEKVLEPGDKPIKPPTHCPYCGEPLVSRNDILSCVNDSCRHRWIQNITYLCSKRVLNIKGVSENTITKLVKKKILWSTFGVFELTKEDFLSIEGYKDKSAQNAVNAIAKSRENVDLAHFVAACCVPNIGLAVGELLMEKYTTYENLLKALLDRSCNFTNIEGIGDATNELLRSKDFIDAYRKLREYITPIAREEQAQKENGVSYTFVITGKLSQPRSYFEDVIKAAGSKIAGSVTKNTDYLLCEDVNSQSTKAKKARELGVTVITEAQLADILFNK